MTEHAITVQLPLDARDVAALQASAEADAPAYASLTVASADDYTFADELLTAVVRRKDAAIAMRQQATRPMYAAIKTIEGWFRPLVNALEDAEVSLKNAMGRYRLEQNARELAARDAARLAATTGDAPALVTALTTASHAAQAPAGRASVSLAWHATSVNSALLPREYLVADMPRIQALARAHKGDAPPVLAGVTFERVSRVGARR